MSTQPWILLSNWRRLVPRVRRRVWLGLAIYAVLFYLLDQWLPFEDWTGGWIFLVFTLLSSYAALIVTVAVNPEVLNARARRHPDAEGWDRVLVTIIVMLSISHFVVATLDAAIYWWAPLPPWWALWGILLTLPAYALSVWALCVNPHFEPLIRVQADRGHQVVMEGPYRHVRHPGYAGTLLYFLATPLILGSGWCFLTGVAAAAAIVVRTAMEDRFLRRRLDGYAEYAKRVPHRLIPGVW